MKPNHYRLNHYWAHWARMLQGWAYLHLWPVLPMHFFRRHAKPLFDHILSWAGYYAYTPRPDAWKPWNKRAA